MEVAQMLQLFAVIIVAGLVFGKLSKYLKLPDVVLFIIAGIILGPRLLNIVNIDTHPLGNDLILQFGAAYILYDGGKEIRLKVLNKVKISLVLLSTLGVLVSTVIVGYFASIIFNIDFTSALLIGAIIASTDPSVLVPLFKNMNLSPKLKQVIIAESAFNDAAGAITTFAVIGILIGGQFSVGDTLISLLVTSFGGIIVGGIIGYIASLSISDSKYGIFSDYASEIAIAAVASAYVVSTYLEVSAFMAVFVIGIICGNKKLLNINQNHERTLDATRFKEVLTLIFRMMIFILLGTHIDFNAVFTYWPQSLLVVAVLVFIARPISVLVSVIFDREAKWSKKEIIYLCTIRETGVIPAALAGMLVSQKALDPTLVTIVSSVTFLTILLTLSVQASTANVLARKLNLDLTINSEELVTNNA